MGKSISAVVDKIIEGEILNFQGDDSEDAPDVASG